MDWTNEAMEQLRALWAEGHSTAEIGRRMGVTKNAVVGKAHRLNLAPRPSPIRREAGAALAPRPRPERRAAPTPPRSVTPPVRRLVGGFPPATALRRLAPMPAMAAPPRPAAPPPPPPPPAQTTVVRHFPRAAPRHCCWPMGEPGTAEFRYCGGDALPAKPYCADHAAIAYVKVRDRREDAA
jgi:GcrA cell cycle regulator